MDGDKTKTTENWADYVSAKPDTTGGKYLRKFWQPVALSREIEAGKAMPLRIMEEKFTLYRGETDTAHVVGYRCAHRATQLSTGWVKDDCIQCMYHGWTYDGDGNCVARPGEKPAGPFERANIPAYPTQEHLGVIFAYFGEGEPPEFPPFDGYKEIGQIETHALEFPSNWFQTMENHFDETHVAFVHTFSGSHNNLGRSEYDLPEMNIYETDYGMIRETKVPGGALRKTLYLMPNIMRIIIPTFGDLTEVGGWRDTYIILVPTDDENHRVFFIKNVHIDEKDMPAFENMHAAFQDKIKAARPVREITEEILDGNGHLNDYLDHPYILILEDAVTQGGQGRITDRSLEMLGRTDAGVAAFRRVYLREMQAMLDGRPLKDWIRLNEEPALGF